VKPTLPANLLETVQLIATGYTNRQIATRTGVTPAGVKSRVVALLRFLGAQDRAHAVAVAYRAGILDVGQPTVLEHWPVEDVPVGKLIEARVALGQTQAQVAHRLGKSTSWLFNREAGRYPFTVGTALGYARIVGVDLAEQDPGRGHPAGRSHSEGAAQGPRPPRPSRPAAPAKEAGFLVDRSTSRVPSRSRS
jgi:DNA-binding CsgD family transcriptional regulator/transcriptional regulator with XRE-family HTH domain